MVSQSRHEWAVERAHNERELAELLGNLEAQGYTIRDIFASATVARHEPIVYTVVAVRDRPIPLPPVEEA